MSWHPRSPPRLRTALPGRKKFARADSRHRRYQDHRRRAGDGVEDLRVLQGAVTRYRVQPDVHQPVPDGGDEYPLGGATRADTAEQHRRTQRGHQERQGDHRARSKGVHMPKRTASRTAATPPDCPQVIVSGPDRRRHPVREPARPAGGKPAGLIGFRSGQGSGPPAAMADRVANSSPSSDAPPTRAPSISVCLVSSPTFFAFTEPP